MRTDPMCANGVTRHYYAIDGTCQRCGHNSRALARVMSNAAHARSVFAADREQYAEWPCDDYEAPLTCFTVPSGRKQPICDGCRSAFPRGADVQRLYRASAYRWTRSDGDVIFIDPSEIARVLPPEDPEETP